MIDENQYIGRVFTLVEPIKNGEGKARIHNNIWLVEGPDCPIGQVKVVGVKKNRFQVEPVEENIILTFIFSLSTLALRALSLIIWIIVIAVLAYF